MPCNTGFCTQTDEYLHISIHCRPGGVHGAQVEIDRGILPPQIYLGVDILPLLIVILIREGRLSIDHVILQSEYPEPVRLIFRDFRKLTFPCDEYAGSTCQGMRRFVPIVDHLPGQEGLEHNELMKAVIRRRRIWT